MQIVRQPNQFEGIFLPSLWTSDFERRPEPASPKACGGGVMRTVGLVILFVMAAAMGIFK
jgi:hypothetical protein